jgi:hypothetical protein
VSRRILLCAIDWTPDSHHFEQSLIIDVVVLPFVLRLIIESTARWEHRILHVRKIMPVISCCQTLMSTSSVCWRHLVINPVVQFDAVVCYRSGFKKLSTCHLLSSVLYRMPLLRLEHLQTITGHPMIWRTSSSLFSQLTAGLRVLYLLLAVKPAAGLFETRVPYLNTSICLATIQATALVDSNGFKTAIGWPSPLPGLLPATAPCFPIGATIPSALNQLYPPTAAAQQTPNEADVNSRPGGVSRQDPT